MTDEERYLFDLQGYLVLRGVLTQEEVGELNGSRIGCIPGIIRDGNDSKGRRGIPQCPLCFPVGLQLASG